MWHLVKRRRRGVGACVIGPVYVARAGGNSRHVYRKFAPLCPIICCDYIHNAMAVRFYNDTQAVKPLFIDVVFTHAEVEHIDLQQFGFVAVIDVLRATTTIVTALEKGARGVVPVARPEDAREVAAAHVDVLLAGERGARMIPGFHLGNSPLECESAVVNGKLIALTTTNGTQAFQSVLDGSSSRDKECDVGARGTDATVAENGTDHAAGAQPIIVAACLRNAGAVARQMAAIHKEGCTAGLIVCAGTDGRFSWDDAYCAAVLVTEISQRVSTRLGDGARAAIHMLNGSERADRRPQGAIGDANAGGIGSQDGGAIDVSTAPALLELSVSTHGRRLLDMGLEADVQFCAQTSVSDVVPRLIMGMLVWEGTAAADGE